MKKHFFWMVAVMIFLVGCINTVYKFDDEKIEYLGHLDFGPAYSIQLEGNLAYLSHNAGVEIVDVSNPRQPIAVSRVELDDGAFGLNLNNGLLCVAGDSEGFYTVDVKDPKRPAILGQFNRYQGTYQAVAVTDEIAFIGIWEGQLVILDIHDPARPQERAHLQMPRGLTSLLVVGDYLYVGTYDGIKLIDIRDVENPRVMDSGLGELFAQKMKLRGNTLYMASHQWGIHVLDVGIPAEPKVIGSFSDGGEANGLFLQDQRLYVSDQHTGVVELLDIQNPGKPQKITEFRGCHPHAVIVRFNMMYLATTGKGLYILKVAVAGVGPS